MHWARKKEIYTPKKKNFLVAGAKVVMIQMSNKTKLEFSPIFFLLKKVTICRTFISMQTNERIASRSFGFLSANGPFGCG